MGRLHLGTTSWSESSWVGVFYPPGSKPGEYLTHYGRRFTSVEVDSTYYAPPADWVVDGWDRKTPDEFVLSAKFPRDVVHGGDGPRPEPGRILRPCAAADQFLESMARLGRKLGPLVLQFPRFHRSLYPGPEPFVEQLDRYLGNLPGEHRYAVEVRNPGWLAPPLLDVLRRHRAAAVLSDLAALPHPDELGPIDTLITADFSYCRLIGDRHGIERETRRWDRLVQDRSDRLERWATLIRDLLERVVDVHVYANNHFEGHAPATADRLARLVGRPRSPRPEWAVQIGLFRLPDTDGS